MAGKTLARMRFGARDDSGRLDSAVQAGNPGLCCRSADLPALANVSFALTVLNATRPSVLFPTPTNGTRSRTPPANAARSALRS